MDTTYIRITVPVTIGIRFKHFLSYYKHQIRKRPNLEFFAEPEPNRTSYFVLPNRNEPKRTETEPNFCAYDLRSYELKLIKVLAELANLNHCAVSFLSRAAVNLSLYNSSPVMKGIEFWRLVMSLQGK